MKRILEKIIAGMLIATLAVLTVMLMMAPDDKQTTQNGVTTSSLNRIDDTGASGGIAIEYAEYNGAPVELSVSGEDAILRVFTGNELSESDDDSVLAYLTHEVERLTTGKEVRLGEDGYTFQMTSGKPIWGPHATSMGPHRHYKCLEFAENVHIDDKTITAVGRLDPIRPEECYPYKVSLK